MTTPERMAEEERCDRCGHSFKEGEAAWEYASGAVTHIVCEWPQLRQRRSTTKGDAMSVAESTIQEANVVEYVKASEVRAGDKLLVVTSILTVTDVKPYDLAYAGGEPVRAQGPGGRWRVLHIMSGSYSLVRFPHEDVMRLAHV